MLALLKAKLKHDGRRIVFGKDFQSTQNGFRKLEDEKYGCKKELVSFEREFLDIDEANIMTDVVVDIVKWRKIERLKCGNILINKSKVIFIQYYANSLIHLVH